jgi:hypothetical protein
MVLLNNLLLFGVSQRNAINQILRYASKNRLPEGLKEQMLAHMQLKFKTAELQQEEVLEDLPKAIRTSIALHLFHGVVASTYLFKGVSEDLLTQLVNAFALRKTCISKDTGIATVVLRRKVEIMIDTYNKVMLTLNFLVLSSR